MNEPFCSVYSKSYRHFKKEPQFQTVKPCNFYENLEENFVPVEDALVTYDQEKNDAIIRELYIKRLISTYQAAYCAKGKKRSETIDSHSLEDDQFMIYFNKLYGPKKGPVLRPVDTSRTVHGFSPFYRYYTGLTDYQDEIGREAYNYFKKDFDLGKSRLFGKKQRNSLTQGKNEFFKVKCGAKHWNLSRLMEVDIKANENIEKDMKANEKIEEGTEGKAVDDTTEKKSEETESEKEKIICSDPKEKICVICLEKYDDFSGNKKV